MFETKKIDQRGVTEIQRTYVTIIILNGSSSGNLTLPFPSYVVETLSSSVGNGQLCSNGTMNSLWR